MNEGIELPSYVVVKPNAKRLGTFYREKSSTSFNLLTLSRFGQI
ncbi:hypothetical protein [Coxiella burnetii]|uniref:Uncharacterized protein n=2 Tax=Coxiella burnetii TaxID=777 RepID=Q83BK8_COXBU|nr:hypothetical protein [Coxiella burnetii]NP_820480.1 hypothetical protein CBU_1497 [Coxiella burnetii RSA 493]AAO90994.1 hypothetical protein CBU_1497 [Coxiella burnetii RSA 493]ABS76676.1 hypothetical protein CBUD_0486 [Coxiella burnetii Dugway 5J108-111]ABX78105.1 hypothetical protein COXBURSA331_A1681 [Coxiella burnetii RSA 331]ACJ17930.1 hypothetical protein CbuG_0510 [Coxiella burnetii CbuG_Q212]ACJ20860.1 hypothetical protein CbuK_1727 [Coxiella burnetii CbuK_Q154]